ncbi:MAG: HigA family addiction module antitoxin [Sphingobium sp.]|uniref:HigA family addiction module antitoxin n=1 Tax=Sphingobium sp. TaxID=1912891 RepID=UPI002E22BDE5
MSVVLEGLPPTHPGEILREDILPSLRLSKVAVAKLLRISRQHLYDIMNEEKPVTPQMALRLSKLLGNSPEFWTNMQAAYDIAVEKKAMADELDLIQALEIA